MLFMNRYTIEKLFWLKISSFITSMLPLGIYLIIKYRSDNEYAFLNIKYITARNSAFLFFIIEIISFIYLIYFFQRIKKSTNVNRSDYNLTNIEQQKTNTSDYLLANVLPVVTLQLDSVESSIFFIILIILLGIMYIKNDLYYINPIYDFLNIKTYTCDACEYKNNKKGKAKKKYVISFTKLYDFENNKYLSVDYGDTLIVTKRS